MLTSVSRASSAHQQATVAVIGGGSVGTSFIRQLADELVAGTQTTPIGQVIVLEPSDHPGAGDAYQPDTPSNLLNTRVASMSPIAADPQHFHRWLLAHPQRWRPQFPGLEPTPDSFVPRALFGLYMADVFEEAVTRLQALGVRVEHIKHRVAAVRRSAFGYEVHTSQGRCIEAQSVVLAIGNLETRAWDHLRAHPGYFNTPYPCTKLITEIDAKRSVCILGTSLSAIDAAVSLADAGHTGKIIMVSRNGRLPSVRGEQNLDRKPRLLTRERMQALALQRQEGVSLMEIAQLLFQELEICEGQMPCLDAILRTGEGPHRYLDSEISDALAHDRAWQAIVYALNDSIDLIWHMLSTDQKREFQAKFKSLWHSYRVSFPVQNARKLQRLLHTDQLTVYGGYQDVCFDDVSGRFAVHVADAVKGFEATLYADHVVNATGYTTDVSNCRSALLRGMLMSGLVVPDEFGGIQVHFDTGHVISRSGGALPGLFALGSLATGTYFWTNAMNVNTRLAAGVVPQVIQDCASALRLQAVAQTEALDEALELAA